MAETAAEILLDFSRECTGAMRTAAASIAFQLADAPGYDHDTCMKIGNAIMALHLPDEKLMMKALT